jgi:hypothetical protein
MYPIDYLTRFWSNIILPRDILTIGDPGKPPVSPRVMAWLTLLSGVGGIIMFIDWLIKLMW